MVNMQQAGGLPADFDGLPIPETDDPKQYVADVTRASGSSFFLPMMLLPRPRREAMLALYAFCRETDDVADEIEDDVLSSALIKAWAEEIKALYEGRPSHPVSHALVGPIKRYGLPESLFQDILEGFEKDRSGAMLRPSLEELERYCYCVACCVGLLSVEIFGYSAPSIPTFALHLGHAFQLTNILRDVAEDAERGRIYLPAELLAKQGLQNVTPEDILKTPGVEKVCAELGSMARSRFDEASRAMPSAERRNMRPALLMRGVYEPYLDRIEATGFRVDGPRIKFGKFKKLSMVFSALLRTL
jgi:phytoene synthase